MVHANRGVHVADGSMQFANSGVHFVDYGVQFANLALKFASFGSNCNYKFLNVSSKCTLAMIVCFMMTYTTSKRKAKPNSSSSVAESNREES